MAKIRAGMVLGPLAVLLAVGVVPVDAQTCNHHGDCDNEMFCRSGDIGCAWCDPYCQRPGDTFDESSCPLKCTDPQAEQGGQACGVCCQDPNNCPPSCRCGFVAPTTAPSVGPQSVQVRTVIYENYVCTIRDDELVSCIGSGSTL